MQLILSDTSAPGRRAPAAPTAPTASAKSSSHPESAAAPAGLTSLIRNRLPTAFAVVLAVALAASAIGAEMARTIGRAATSAQEADRLGVSEIVADIAVQAHTQSEGTARLDAAMGELDLTTQQNAALVEESAAATERLASQAAELERLVRQFRL